MGNPITCDIVTPERHLFSAEVAFVVAPAANGEIGILENHTPFVSTLDAGEVRLRYEGSDRSHRFVIAGGYVEVKNNVVRILADHARSVFDIDVEAVKQRLKDVEKKLEDAEPGTETYTMLQEEREWNRVQQYVVGKKPQ